MSIESLDKVIFLNFDQPPWPSFVKPFHDESLTSWLLRLSRNHLLRFYTFCSTYFPGVECWNRDLDKFLPDEIRKIVRSKSILNEYDIDNMLLSSFYSKVYLADLNSRNFWFTPISTYQYTRTHKTTYTICPKCLNSDNENPYFRKHWRLSFQTVCENCEINLIDCCPNCGSSINYLIIEKGRKGQIPIFPITYCWKCLFDLKQSTITNAIEANVKMQRELKLLYENGYDISHEIQYSHLYFLVFKKIISLLNKANSSQLVKLQELICEQTNLEFISPKNGRKFPFELMSVEDRRNLSYKAFWLLEEWPHRFRELTSKSALRSKYFTDDFFEIPYWFQGELLNNKLIYSEWRKYFPEYSYSSFNELAEWRVSKSKRKIK